MAWFFFPLASIFWKVRHYVGGKLLHSETLGLLIMTARTAATIRGSADGASGHK